MVPMMSVWRGLVNKEYPLQTNLNWNDIFNYGIVTEKLDLLEKDHNGILLYTWMTIQTSSFIWQFYRDPRDKFRRGVWIVAPIGVYCLGSVFLEERASALLIALTANAVATVAIKKYARTDEFRRAYGLNTYNQDLKQIKEMQAKQKEARILYTGVPEHLIPTQLKSFVPKAKQTSWTDDLSASLNSVAQTQGAGNKNAKDMNKMLYKRHRIGSSDSQIKNFQQNEFKEYQSVKEKTFSFKKWSRYSLREKHDRKIFGFIPQDGYLTKERKFLKELESDYSEGKSTVSKEEAIDKEVLEAQKPEVEEMPNYFKINLDQIYKDGSVENSSDWADKDQAGLMAPLKNEKFGKIGKLSPMRHVQ